MDIANSSLLSVTALIVNSASPGRPSASTYFSVAFVDVDAPNLTSNE
jgi:hypothetical protein